MRKRTLLISLLALTAVFPVRTEGRKSASYSTRQGKTQRSSEAANVSLKTATPTNADWRVSEKFPIHVRGDEAFIKRTEEALCLIKDKAPKSYSMLTNYHFIIQRGRLSGITPRSTPPVFRVDNKTFGASLDWYASCIIHDSYHLKLYKDYRKRYGKNVPVTVFAGREPENMCLSAQQDFYREINMPISVSKIKNLERLKSVDYFTKAAQERRLKRNAEMEKSR